MHILLPQVMPRLLDTTSPLGAAWLLIGRDDFSDRRFGISDRFGQKVFGDGCDNSLRALDYVFGLRHGLVFAYL